ncbi:MAG: class I SAM-dependent rRNA methyltransferase [Verrucomicrobiota bacterium]|nr:class I SAM-dependent rRNA methyltransferase [Verrucomicrobiota bacterium]
MTLPIVVVHPRKGAAFWRGHPWVYVSDLISVQGEPESGDVVEIQDKVGRVHGSALYNPKSQIVLRRFSFQSSGLNLADLRKKISKAVNHRKGPDGQWPANARLVWSESDFLPGLIVDKLGDVLVVQTVTMGMDRRLGGITSVLQELLEPRLIYERNDSGVRELEGLPIRTGILAGGGPLSFEVDLNGLRFLVNLESGQKTSLYLDQVESYRQAEKYFAGKTVLDCFTYHGGFALHAARMGATSVTAIDSSGPALLAARVNATLNKLNVTFHEANVFDFLKDEVATRKKYDVIVLDPPSFARTKNKVNDAMRGYKEIHLRALKLLNPGGFLLTYSCSHHVTGEVLREVVVDAANDARRQLRLVELVFQPSDHPVLMGFPESEYLKGFILQDVDP